MVTYVFDASAVLRYIDDEAGAARVHELINDHLDGECHIAISAVQWGEIAAKLAKNSDFEETFAELQMLGFRIVPATADRATKSGLLKVHKKISYADAFGVELAQSIPESVLVTADYDAKPAATMIKIEFLPTK